MTEEKRIGDRLYFREYPEADWTPYSIESLTISFIAMRGAYERAIEREKLLKERLKRITEEVMRR